MTPTQVMEAEHRLIETVVKALGGVAAALEKGQPAGAAILPTAVEFFRVYADKLHHGKEETVFFPMLVKRGVPPQGCPIGGLNHEHEKGRALVQALADQAPAYAQGKPGAKEALLETLRGIVDLYQNHIWKEDAMVFPMADKVLTAADQAELSEKFGEVDRAVGLDVVARLETFANSLGTSGQAPMPSAAAKGENTFWAAASTGTMWPKMSTVEKQFSLNRGASKTKSTNSDTYVYSHYFLPKDQRRQGC